MHSKFAKSANLTQKLMGSIIKNAEFYGDSKVVEMGSKKSRKKFWVKNYANLEFLRFALFSVVFSFC